MTFYGTLASAAGWITPKKYFEKVGPDGFKKHPIGLGPYKFVSMKPGIELVMEANENYWRKVPSVKRLVFLSVPEGTTRLAMLKRGEVDVAYLLEGQLGKSIRNDPDAEARLLGRGRDQFPRFLRHVGPEIAVARSSACARRRAWRSTGKALSDADTLGASKPNGNVDAEEHGIRAADRSRSLRSGAGQEAARGGRLSERVRCRRSLRRCRPISRPARRSSAYLGAIGIRTRLRTMERAAFFSALQSKKLKGRVFLQRRRSRATPRPACRRSCRATASMPMAAGPMSMSCTRSS